MCRQPYFIQKLQIHRERWEESTGIRLWSMSVPLLPIHIHTFQINGTVNFHLAFRDCAVVLNLVSVVFIIKKYITATFSKMFLRIQEYENLNAGFDDLIKYWFVHAFMFSKTID